MILNIFNYKIIIKFRTSNQPLAIEKSRYQNVERHRRYCELCDGNIIGGEFNLLLEYKNVDNV